MRSFILICLSAVLVFAETNHNENQDVALSLKLDLLQRQFDRMVKENESFKRKMTKENGELRKLLYSLNTKQKGDISNERNDNRQSADIGLMNLKALNNISSRTSTTPDSTKGNQRTNQKLVNFTFPGVHDFEGTRVERQTSNSGGSISFHATVLDTLTDIGNNQKIPFKNIHIDTHNAFDGAEGVFTCPSSGVYAFFATILTFPGTRVEFEIYKNGNWIAAGYSKDDKQTWTFGTGTTQGIARLETGDKVWVAVNDDAHEGSGEMIYKGYSSFMGFSINLE